MYSLLSFGIPVGALPVHHDGDVKNGPHHKWLSKRKANEESMKQSDQPLVAIIDLPARNDVILWRGRVYQLHPGNVRMRTLIGERQDEYNRAARGEKGNIAMEIVLTIKNVEGGRFLTQDPGGWWVEVSDKEAQKRVSKSFRSARSTTRKSTTAIAVGKDGGFEENGHDTKRLRIASPTDSSDSMNNNRCICPETFTATTRPDSYFAG
jgi:hypothetical protein